MCRHCFALSCAKYAELCHENPRPEGQLRTDFRIKTASDHYGTAEHRGIPKKERTWHRDEFSFLLASCFVSVVGKSFFQLCSLGLGHTFISNRSERASQKKYRMLVRGDGFVAPSKAGTANTPRRVCIQILREFRLSGRRTNGQILLPKQEAIKASRGRGASGRLNGFVSRKNPPGPYFSIVIVKAKVGYSRSCCEVSRCGVSKIRVVGLPDTKPFEATTVRRCSFFFSKRCLGGTRGRLTHFRMLLRCVRDLYVSKRRRVSRKAKVRWRRFHTWTRGFSKRGVSVNAHGVKRLKIWRGRDVRAAVMRASHKRQK